jgi:hypothetical protein
MGENMGRPLRGTNVAAVGLAAFVGLGALLTGCGAPSDHGPSSDKVPSSATSPTAPASEGGSGSLRKPTSSELDSTWFPQKGTGPLGITGAKALMPTVHDCYGAIAFGAEVTLTFPCGTDRAQGTLRVDPSGDKLTVSWADGPTDAFIKRPDLTAPEPTLTGVPSMEDLQRQLDEMDDLTESVAGGATGS